MNKQRRKEIETLLTRAEILKSDIETIRDEEAEYAEEMPENLHGSEKHEAAEEVVALIEEAVDALDTVNDALTGASE